MNTQLIDSLTRIILSLSEEKRELLNRKIKSEQQKIGRLTLKFWI